MRLIWDAIRENCDKLKQDGHSDETINQLLMDIDFEKIITSVTDEMASDHANFFENTMYEKVVHERARTAEFLARNEQVWCSGFIASEAMYLIVLEIAENMRQVTSAQPGAYEDRKFRCYVLRELHGRACQQYLEIIYLIKGGFADSAYARWRSLYELSVISEFIRHNDEEVAKAYYDASFTDDGRFDWAKSAPCFASKKGKVTFENIKAQCTFSSDAWNSSYRLANKVVHATPQGTFGRIGSPNDQPRAIPVGHSDYGLAMPAINAAISLGIVSTDYLGLIYGADRIVYMKTISRWVEIVRKTYEEIEQSCFPSETPSPTDG